MSNELGRDTDKIRAENNGADALMTFTNSRIEFKDKKTGEIDQTLLVFDSIREKSLEVHTPLDRNLPPSTKLRKDDKAK